MTGEEGARQAWLCDQMFISIPAGQSCSAWLVLGWGCAEVTERQRGEPFCGGLWERDPATPY